MGLGDNFCILIKFFDACRYAEMQNCCILVQISIYAELRNNLLYFFFEICINAEKQKKIMAFFGLKNSLWMYISTLFRQKISVK